MPRILPLILILGLLSCKSKYNPYKYVSQVKIEYVNKSILTFIQISCDNFEMSFGSRVNSLTIFEQKEISKLTSYLNSSTLAVDSDPDVRVKVYLYEGDNLVEFFCFGNGYDLMSSKSGLSNKSFIDFVNKLIEKHS